MAGGEALRCAPAAQTPLVLPCPCAQVTRLPAMTQLLLAVGRSLGSEERRREPAESSPKYPLKVGRGCGQGPQALLFACLLSFSS